MNPCQLVAEWPFLSSLISPYILHFRRYLGLRLIIMRSDSELVILGFASGKRMDLLLQFDFAKSDGMKSVSRIRWPKSSNFGSKSGDSTHRFTIPN